MSWLTRMFTTTQNDDETGYKSAYDNDNLPVAHAVALAPSDSQDFARPPPMNPTLMQQQQHHQNYSASMSSTAAPASKQPPVVPTAKVITTRTYTIPAGSPLLQGQHVPAAHTLPTHSHFKHNQQPMPFEFGRSPQLMPQCPECGAMNARTRIRTFPNWLTWCMVVALVFLFWPLCWLPLVVDSLKQTDHYCMACGKKAGSVPPFKNVCVKTSV
jgi:hypothetical protein